MSRRVCIAVEYTAGVTGPKYDADIRVRVPRAYIDLLDKQAAKVGLSRSEWLRQLVERALNEKVREQAPRRLRRFRRLRRCISCGAFVRNSYTCRMCRTTMTDRVVLGGAVVPNPLLPREGFRTRPDIRDPRWHQAEAVVLDAFAPVVAVMYEIISGVDSYEPTDLDEIADLLTVAASLQH